MKDSSKSRSRAFGDFLQQYLLEEYNDPSELQLQNLGAELELLQSQELPELERCDKEVAEETLVGRQVNQR
ncbi:MAG: hypothetical protein ABEJ24_03050 [Candidatus Magasanikbacteria bacterium]